MSSLQSLPPGQEPPSDPLGALRWMNEKHFVVIEAGKTVVTTEWIDPELDRRMLMRSSFGDLKNYYCNKWVNAKDSNGNSKRVPLGHYWLNANDRRQFKGIVCAPGGDVEGYYNLWKGFSVDPRKGDWSLMQAHIADNICAGRDEVYRYVLGWMAFAVQKPNVLPEVALVMRGKQGTGKGVFARGFGKLFGQHFLHVARPENLVGNFNAHLRDAIVVFADEASLVGDKVSEGVLKALITEEELTIEGKFKDIVTCRNLVHLIVASNNERIINAAPEERRFCVLDVSDKHMQQTDYFAAIANQMDEGGREAMLYDLEREDLKVFDPRKYPATGALQDQKIQSMPPEVLWWFKTLQRGWLTTERDGWPTEVLRRDLLNEYRAGTKRFQDEAQDLGYVLKKLLPDGYPGEGPRPTVDGERQRMWAIPSLDMCRAEFEKNFKMSNCWPDEG